MPGRSQQVGPVRYALLARAVADAARGLDDLRDVRAVVADAVQRGRCRVRDLSAELMAGPDVRSALFREALADVADGIRSTAEGDLKDLLIRSGLPMPLFNAEIQAALEGARGRPPLKLRTVPSREAAHTPRTAGVA